MKINNFIWGINYQKRLLRIYYDGMQYHMELKEKEPLYSHYDVIIGDEEKAYSKVHQVSIVNGFDLYKKSGEPINTDVEIVHALDELAETRKQLTFDDLWESA